MARARDKYGGMHLSLSSWSKSASIGVSLVAAHMLKYVHADFDMCTQESWLQDIGPMFHINGALSSVVGSRKCSSGRILVATD